MCRNSKSIQHFFLRVFTTKVGSIFAELPMQREGYPETRIFSSNVGYVLAQTICFVFCQHNPHYYNKFWFQGIPPSVWGFKRFWTGLVICMNLNWRFFHWWAWIEVFPCTWWAIEVFPCRNFDCVWTRWDSVLRALLQLIVYLPFCTLFHLNPPIFELYLKFKQNF